MNRQPIDTGGWFDKDKAQLFEQDKFWDGNNFRSVATGGQWEHQCLWLTRGGRWVLVSWSQWQGSGPPRWEEIDVTQAAAWLVWNDHTAEELPEWAPEGARKALEREIQKSER